MKFIGKRLDISWTHWGTFASGSDYASANVGNNPDFVEVSREYYGHGGEPGGFRVEIPAFGIDETIPVETMRGATQVAELMLETELLSMFTPA